MIKVTFYEDSQKIIRRCMFSGHAGYAEEGADIICSAVSILYINTFNAIENFTTDKVRVKEVKSNNFHDFSFCDMPSESAQLLMNTLAMGLDTIKNEYGSRYLKITHKEVQ